MNYRIQMKAMTLAYEEPVLLDVNQEVNLPSKGIVTFLGRNGSGKSTLLRALAGCIRPVSGELLIAPTPKYLQYVGQVPAVLPHLSPGENARFFSGVKYWKSRYSERALKETAMMLEAEDLLVGQGMSGGQERLIAILRAFSVRPDLLVLDEPFSSLDAERRRSLASVLAKSTESTECITLIATHMPHEVLAFSRSVVGLVGRSPIRQLECVEANRLASASESLRSLCGLFDEGSR